MLKKGSFLRELPIIVVSTIETISAETTIIGRSRRNEPFLIISFSIT